MATAPGAAQVDRGIPYSPTCTWYNGAPDYPEKPSVCGDPVVAEWFHGTKRISCLCKKHDRMAARFAAKVNDGEHIRKEVGF